MRPYISIFLCFFLSIPVLPQRVRVSGGAKISGGVTAKGVAAGGGGPVAYDNSSKAQCNSDTCTTGTTLTFSHTTGSGSNRGMAVGCTVSGGSATVQPNISTITYAGTSLSQLAKRDANYDTYIWTLPNGVQPTSGANNVVVTLASAIPNTADYLTCVAITVTGVHQTTAWTASDCTGAGSGTSASCTLGSSGANDLGVAFACNGTSIGSGGTGVTVRQFTDNTLGSCNSFGGATVTGGTTSISISVGDDTWQILGAAFKSS